MKPLSISKALQLYKIIAPHFPEEIDDSFNFVGKIIDNIKNSGRTEDYTDAITLMSGVDFDRMISMDSYEILELFLNGIKENRWFLLRDFCKKVGFNA